MQKTDWKIFFRTVNEKQNSQAIRIPKTTELNDKWKFIINIRGSMQVSNKIKTLKRFFDNMVRDDNQWSESLNFSFTSGNLTGAKTSHHAMNIPNWEAFAFQTIE